MLVARRYVVGGRVQGVGFRVHVQDAAAQEGLRGWVRNRDSGDVEVWAEGDLEAVVRFERTLAIGPARGRVTQVTTHDETPGGLSSGFHIRG